MKPSKPLAAILSVVVVSALSCGAPDEGSPGTSDEAQPPTRPTEEHQLLVSTEWLAGHLDDDDIVVLQIDRRASNFEEGHIPGALFVAWGNLTTDAEVGTELPSVEALESLFEGVGVSNDAHVVVYGGHIFAARAFMTLEYLGHERVSVLDGGLDRWRDENREMVTGPEEGPTAEFAPRVSSDLVVSAAWIMDNLGSPSVALLDARPDNEYGAPTKDGTRKAGHIPGAENLFYRDLIRSEDDPRYLDSETMSRLFQAAGADEGDMVVSYCAVGMRASVDYFVARLLGYETRFYDGSWNDWSRRDLPTEVSP